MVNLEVQEPFMIPHGHAPSQTALQQQMNLTFLSFKELLEMSKHIGLWSIPDKATGKLNNLSLQKLITGVKPKCCFRIVCFRFHEQTIYAASLGAAGVKRSPTGADGN